MKNRATYVPIFKYLREVGVEDEESYRKHKFTHDRSLDRFALKKVDDFRLKNYSKTFIKKYKDISIHKIIEDDTPERAIIYIPFIPKDEIDLESLKIFLIQNEEKLYAKDSTNFRKLAVLYDKLKWGW